MKKPNAFQRYKPMLLVAVPVVAATAALAYVVWLAMGEPVHSGKKFVQQVQLLRPPPAPEEPPPPPPPPPEVDQPPPPEETAKADASEPPPGDQLGLDADAAAGSDAFGLAARKGGRDLLGSGDGNFDWYKNAVGTELAGRLSGNQKIRRKRYSVPLRIWLAGDGRIERFHLDGSTGDDELDRQLSAVLSDLGRISEAPPEGLPQPVRLRIVSRI